jgi:hypothetical protein
MTGASNWIEATRARTISSSNQRWRRDVRPSRENLGRCRNKLTGSIIPRRNKKIDPPDGFWVGIAMEVFKALYPGGSEGFGLRGSGIPIGA